MNKLKQILKFIRALLGFLLNLKKKKTDEKNEKPPRPIPGKFRTMCRTIRLRTALALYLASLGIMALWADRSEVVLGCIGALLTLSEYGQTARDKPPPSWDGH